MKTLYQHGESRTYQPWQKTAAHGTRLVHGLAGGLLKRRPPALAWRN